MEILMINIFVIIILGTLCFMGGIIFATRNNNNIIKNNNQRTSYRYNNTVNHIDGNNNMSNSIMGNIHGKVNSRQNMESDRCYKKGELTNICTVIALKNIQREIPHLLSKMENDAINKAIKNTISLENLYNWIELTLTPMESKNNE